jgi:hypothetical protein
MKPVVDCLLILRAKTLSNSLGDTVSSTNSNASSPRGFAASSFHYSPPSSVTDQRKVSTESTRFQGVMSSPLMAGPVNFIKLILSLLYVFVVHIEIIKSNFLNIATC